jgi:outer membrane lipoprotein SlyB
MSNVVFVSSLVVAATLLTGCAGNFGGNDYSARGVGEISQTLKGVIVDARSVTIKSNDQSQFGAGAGIGGIAGALLGSTIGQGNGRLVGGTLGALAGAGAGHLAQGAMTKQEGIEYQVQLNSGETISLTQGAEPRLSVGQRVLVIKSGRDHSRVVPDNSK